MQIQYVKGDLLESGLPIIVHGCNAQGRMGRGIALAIKERLPWAYEAYRAAYEEENKLTLGTIAWAVRFGYPNEPIKIVGNMITQEWWQPEKAVDGRNVDYNAVRSCMKEINAFVQTTYKPELWDVPTVEPIHRVGMPMIGAGLGGGDWEIISKIIEEESTHFQPVVYQL